MHLLSKMAKDFIVLNTNEIISQKNVSAESVFIKDHRKVV